MSAKELEYMPLQRGSRRSPIQLEMERYEVEHEKRLKAEAEAAIMQKIAMAFAGILTLMSIVFYLFPVR